MGGFVPGAPLGTTPLPLSAMAHDRLPLWLIPEGPLPDIRTGRSARRMVCVLGTCGADDHALHKIAVQGVRPPDLWRWPGAYVLVEISERRIALYADLASAVPLYWTRAPSGPAWSTSARALAGLIHAAVNPMWLAVRLLTPANPSAIPTLSAFTGIHRVPGGHRVDLTPAEVRAPIALWSAEPTTNATEAATRFGNALTASVELRTFQCQRLTADLSGGMDSTAVTRVAAENLAGQGRSVAAVTLHHQDAPTGGDLDHVTAAAAHSAIEHHMLALDDRHQLFTGLEEILPPTDEPAPATIGHVFFAHQLRYVRDTFGSDGHLTGDGGDTLLSPPLLYLADLLRTGRPHTALNHALGWAQVRRTHPVQLFKQAQVAAGTPYALAFRRAARVLTGEAKGPGGISLLPVEPPAAWATESARYSAANVYKEAARRADHAAPIGDLANAVTWDQIGEIGRTAAADASLAHTLSGVPLHNTFCDSNVVAAALACPSPTRSRPDAYKPLLIRALPQILPASIAARVTKGESTSDHIRGMRTNMDTVLLLADGHLAALGLLDIDAFHVTARRTAAGIGPGDDVEPVLATEMWLRAHHETPAYKWRYGPAAHPRENE
ncbi:albusnodin/ikarugamycin family macrolactam cyclase [Streptomyces sp. SID3343]|uniref:albusnodin/ikarugamycin family macrolactam cyclase n=1 Tax=Streptomyces sp. SID3343 TaxID=2690260 RepID=UPI0023519739|nr:albusnodin/ikarugamycin family macrolactam cyclase [Streptomyces sp. SID3343]